jgi:hypothetical protein
MGRFIAVALVCVGMFGAELALANMAPPDVRNRPQPFQVTLRDDAGPVRLRVPRELVALAPIGQPDKSRLATLVAGIALACAVTLAGMKLVSRRRVPPAAAVIVLAGGLMLASAAALADLAPRPATQPAQPTADLRVVLELADSGQAIQMTLNAEQASQIAALIKDRAK